MSPTANPDKRMIAERLDGNFVDLRMMATHGGKWHDHMGLFYFPDGSTGYLGSRPIYGLQTYHSVAWHFIASNTGRPV